MDVSTIRVSTTVIVKSAADLMRDALTAAERKDEHAAAVYREGALRQIGSIRKELTDLEIALKGVLAPMEPAPRGSLTLVGAEPDEAA